MCEIYNFEYITYACMQFVKVCLKVPSLVLCCFLFIYINGLTEGLTTNAMLFADDTSWFSLVHDTQTSANDFNKGLEIINNWAFQW